MLTDAQPPFPGTPLVPLKIWVDWAIKRDPERFDRTLFDSAHQASDSFASKNNWGPAWAAYYYYYYIVIIIITVLYHIVMVIITHMRERRGPWRSSRPGGRPGGTPEPPDSPPQNPTYYQLLWILIIIIMIMMIMIPNIIIMRMIITRNIIPGPAHGKRAQALENTPVARRRYFCRQ